MPPDTPQVPGEPLPGTLKDSQTPSPYQSRIRVLLGLPNSGAVPLASTVSLPVFELPYVTSHMGAAGSALESWRGNQWAESELDTRDNWDETGIETLLTDSSQHLPHPKLSELPPSAPQKKTSFNIPYTTQPYSSDSVAASQSPDRSPETEMEGEPQGESIDRTNPSPVDIEPENPLSGLSATPQKTSIHIPGITQTRTSSSLPSSIGTDSSLVKDRNLAEQSTMSYLQPPASVSDSPSVAVATGDSMPDADAAASPTSERAAETKVEGEPQGESIDRTNPSPVDIEPENSLSGLSATPQKTSIRIPGITQTRTSSSLPSSIVTDSSLVEERNLAEQSTMSYFQPPVSVSDLPSVAAATGDSMPNAHAAASPAPERAAETKVEGEPQGKSTDSVNISSSQPAVTGSPRVESTPPVLTTRMVLTPEPVAKAPIAATLAVPTQTTIQGGEVVRSKHQTANSMAAQIEKLKRTVDDLSAQVATQKDFQQSVTPTFPLPSQPQVIVQRSASQPRSPHAFWERSYVSRLYRWSRK